MTGPLVVGVGHRWRGDDGIGPAVTDELSRRGAPWEVITVPDASGLLDCCSPGRPLVIVDAAMPRGTPGRVHALSFQELLHLTHNGETAPLGLGGTSSHGLSVEAVLALASTLGLLPARGAVVAVEGAAFALGQSLSAPVRAALARATDEAHRQAVALVDDARGT